MRPLHAPPRTRLRTPQGGRDRLNVRSLRSQTCPAPLVSRMPSARTSEQRSCLHAGPRREVFVPAAPGACGHLAAVPSRRCSRTHQMCMSPRVCMRSCCVLQSGCADQCWVIRPELIEQIRHIIVCLIFISTNPKIDADDATLVMSARCRALPAHRMPSTRW